MEKKFIIARLLILLLAFVALPARGAGEIRITPIGSYRTGVFEAGAAEIPAYDPASRRLFIVNASQVALDVLDMSNPANPILVSTLDMTDYGGAANSVAVKDGLVAVAVENETPQRAGQVVFLDTDGALLNTVTVGALPDMLTFTPDGQKLLVANEGEPDDEYEVDPQGSISIIDLADGVEQATVTTADFTAFNRQEDALKTAGVRLYGPEATLAQDLEPEYIAVAADGETAWVTLQENNALARLDLNSGDITDIMPLGFKDHSATLQTFTFRDLPRLGVTAAGQDILAGGFSGLYFDGINPDNGNWQFLTHPDRGPTTEPVDLDGDGVNEQPFALPGYQAEIARIELDLVLGAVDIVERIKLTRPDDASTGTDVPITGLPNLEGPPGLAYADEIAVDLSGDPLERDPFGADFEGIVRAPDNTFWLVDEYRPALYHVDASGALIDRFVPEGSNEGGVETGLEAIPAVFAQRRANRGFEAVAYADGKLYAFMQSPLDNPDVDDDANSKGSVNNRILEFDPVTGATTGQYLYIMEGGASDSLSDAVALGNGEFLVIEQDSAAGPKAKRLIFHISLDEATSLNDLADSIVGPGGTLERMSAAQLARAEIEPVKKALFADLGYLAGGKPEGLALIDENNLAVLNDNGFQLAGTFDASTRLLDENPRPIQPTLGLMTLQNPIDASDEDGMINLTSWPIFGMYQPDAIAAFEAAGQTYLITANEGDSRDYEGFSEAVEVADLSLDAEAFPDAETLQQETALGRLAVTGSLGDVDEDGDYDQLYVFGARSFSIWEADGNLVYDSGGQLERMIAQLNPAYFNAANTENNFDSRSNNRGPEPEGLAVGVIAGRTYAFIGLEQASGVAVFDITDPTAPQFVDYIGNRDFSGQPDEDTAGDLGPEGLIFIPAEDSPTGEALLVVANEISGSTTIYEIRPEEPAPIQVAVPAPEPAEEAETATPPADSSTGATEGLATGQEDQEGLLVKNFAGDELTITIGSQSYTVPDQAEQLLPIAPGDYTFVASIPRGAVSGELSLGSDQFITLSIFWDSAGNLASYQE
jgi:hypothetical protein